MQNPCSLSLWFSPLCFARSWTTYSRKISREISGAIPAENVEEDTGDQTGEQTHKPQHSGGGQNAQHHQRQWIGHLISMSDTRLPKQISYFELEREVCELQAKDWTKEVVQRHENKLFIYLWTGRAWLWTGGVGKKQCKKGLHTVRGNLLYVTSTKRKLHKRIKKKKKPSTTTTHTTTSCQHCTKICGSQISLYV